MSEPRKCYVCSGHGYRVVVEELYERAIECSTCKGSGYMALKTAGPGYPPLKPGESPWEPASKGTNW